MGDLPTVAIDTAVCIGSGQCVNYAPESFTQDAEAKAVLLEGYGADLDSLSMAVEACPTGAITMNNTSEESQQ